MWTFSKVSGLALASALLAQTASAQISASGPLTEVNAWGVGWQTPRQGGLPASLWESTNANDIAILLGELDVKALSPAQTGLFSTILQSAGRPPQGEDEEASALRVGHLYALGEGDKARDLQRRFTHTSWGQPVEQSEADKEFAGGYASAACARMEANDNGAEYWLRARPVCFALAGDLNAAELALEVAQSEGLEDAWLRTSIQTLAAPDGPKTPARFDTGVYAQISLAAGLPIPTNVFDALPADRILEISRRDDLDEDTKRRALMKLAELGQLSPADERRALIAQIAPPVEGEPAPAVLRSPLEQGVDALANPDLTLADKATELNTALEAHETDAATFYQAARVLLPELMSMPRERDTAPYAPRFARAALAAGDADLARIWREAMDNPFNAVEPELVEEPQALDLLEQAQPEPVDAIGDLIETVAPVEPPPQPLPPIEHSEWDKARLDTFLAIAQNARDGRQVLAAADYVSERAASGDHVKQAEQLLFVLSGMGKGLPPQARNHLVNAKPAKLSKKARATQDAVDAISRRAIMSERSGALAEASLLALQTFALYQPNTGSDQAFADALSIVSNNGLRANASAIALEAAGLWRAE